MPNPTSTNKNTQDFQQIVELTAISRTLYFFDSILAKISIPINPNKLNDACEWYYLQNLKNENIIGVLLSMYCDTKEKLNSPQNPTPNNDLSFINTHKNIRNDISCDYVKQSNINTGNLFLNIINRTKNISVINESFDNLQLNSNFNGNNNQNNSQMVSLNNSKKKPNHLKLDNSVVSNETIKSPDASHNLISPYSYRNENDRNNRNNCDSGENRNNNLPNFNYNNSNNNSNICHTNTNGNFNIDEFNNEEEFEQIRKKLEKVLCNVKDSNSQNPYFIGNGNGIKEELTDVINKLMHKNKTVKEEKLKIAKSKEEIKSHFDSKN
jgi:hypothetical protein